MRRIVSSLLFSALIMPAVYASTFEDALKEALEVKQGLKEDTAVAFLTNILNASNSVNGKQLASVANCPIGQPGKAINKDAELAEKMVGKFSKKAVKKLFPALVGLLQGAKGVGIGTLLIDGGLSPDPLATIGAAYNVETEFSREELRDAARGTLLTDPAGFANFDARRKAAAFACIL